MTETAQAIEKKDEPTIDINDPPMEFITVELEIPKHYKEFMDRHPAFIGDLGQYASEAVIVSINALYSKLRALSPVEMTAQLIDHFTI